MVVFEPYLTLISIFTLKLICVVSLILLLLNFQSSFSILILILKNSPKKTSREKFQRFRTSLLTEKQPGNEMNPSELAECDQSENLDSVSLICEKTTLLQRLFLNNAVFTLGHLPR